ncbi:MAG: HAD family phosphatase [Cyanobacteria bacterium CRU_2_1]|nr:HAD family phosphatase [Cyanobacteria bacterium RU_5_0]NJR63737.1 HAD family phosphatase [Cyanobacteria bacterium CRU_2_1]
MQERSTRVGENAASQTASVSEVKKIQLLVIDLDGTTVGMSNQFQPAVKETLQAARSKGVKVAIATGRMYRSALRFHEELGLTLPLMVYQGALIKDPATGTVHRHLTIPKDYAMRLLDDLEQPELQDLIAIHCYIDDHLYIREMTSESQEYAARSNIEIIPVGDLRQVLAQEPTKILALSQQSAMIDHLLSSLRQRYTPAELYFTKSVATFFEATHPLVNKGTAVRYLAEEVLGLQAANVMAIGDNFNDLEMIEYAGVGVAMGNAPDDVKAVAHWVAPDVEQDGAAVAIAQFIL